MVKEGKAEAVVTEGRRIQCDQVNYFFCYQICSNLPITWTQVVLPASLVPAELHQGEAEVSSASCSRAVLLSKASLLPTDKEQLTFLSLPKEKDGLREGAAHLIEVGAGTAACPKGLHLLHASTSGKVDLVAEVKPLVASSLLYSLSWQQEEHLTSDCTTSLSNTFLAAGPKHELDLALAIEAARSVHKRLYPEEEFLPRAPDPEEILIGGGEAEENSMGNEKVEELEQENLERNNGEADLEEEKLRGNEKKEEKQSAENIPVDQTHDTTEKNA